MTIPDMHSGVVAVDGRMVSAASQRFYLALKEYDKDLEIMYIPPESHTRHGQPKYKVVYNSETGPYTLFFLRHEDDLNAQALQRIIANDNRNGVSTITEYEAWEAANARIAHQAYLDKLEEAHDVAKHVLQSRKHTYKVNDDMVFKAGVPFNIAHTDVG